MKKFYKSIHQKIYTQNIIRTKLQYEDEFGNSQDMKLVRPIQALVHVSNTSSYILEGSKVIQVSHILNPLEKRPLSASIILVVLVQINSGRKSF